MLFISMIGQVQSSYSGEGMERVTGDSWSRLLRLPLTCLLTEVSKQRRNVFYSI